MARLAQRHGNRLSLFDYGGFGRLWRVRRQVVDNGDAQRCGHAVAAVDGCRSCRNRGSSGRIAAVATASTTRLSANPESVADGGEHAAAVTHTAAIKDWADRMIATLPRSRRRCVILC